MNIIEFMVFLLSLVLLTQIVQLKGLNDIGRFLTWIKDAKNINLYFVVPPDIFEKFPLQKYKTTKDEECQRIPGWINKITQYALEINLIKNKGAKERDDKNEDTSGEGMNKDVKKRKTKKNDVMLGDDGSEEASGSNMGSEQCNLKRSSDAMLVENESGETSKKGKNKKGVKKRKTIK